jgi:iron complex transport system ATP-binding protein
MSPLLTPLLDVKNLNVSRGSKIILSDVSFSVRPGEILGLIGPNGSGKSTLLKTLAGMILPKSGSIELSGVDVLKQSIFDRSRALTYVSDDLMSEFPVTAGEFVGMSRGSAIASSMKETGCLELKDCLVSELSGGERQRVSIARALAQGSKVICLDESLSQLDLHHQSMMGRLLKNYTSSGISFILVAHDLNFTTDWSDRSLLIKDGQVIAIDQTDRLMNAESLKKLYPNVELTFIAHPQTGKKKVFFLT